MKKLITTAISAILLLTMLAGCGGSNDGFAYGSDISVISREDGSGTRGAFVELFGIEEKDSSGNKVDHTTDEAIVVNKTGVVLSNVASDIYSIGYVSLGSLNDTVKALSVNGVDPTTENVKNGTYEISRPFNIAYKGELNEIAQDFLNYILSTQGQAVVEDNGYIAIAEETTEYTASGISGTVKVSGSSSVTPVMQKLAEDYMKINQGVTIEIQTSDSTTGMQDAIEGKCDIGMASRDLKDEEATELKNVEIALDGIAVIVNIENPLTDISSDMVKEIFTGKVTTWEE